jgi:predicted AAA+ superfamily ATPase
MGRKISTHTVERYISGLTDALLFYPVYRYDIKGKEYLKTGEKYYIVDQGLRNLVLGSKTKDFGSVLENIAFLDLYQRGYKISIGKIDNLEVDFVATSPSGEIEYYQICLTVRDETTLNRELKPLYKIRDSHPKYLITLDNDPERQFDGIKQINALEWFRREDPRFLSN